MPESGNTYKIISHKNGTALDLSGTDGVSITGWDSHDGDNQKVRPPSEPNLIPCLYLGSYYLLYN